MVNNLILDSLHKVLNENLIFEDIKKTLFENRGINDEVIKETSKILGHINSKLDQCKLRYDPNTMLSYKQTTFNKVVFGKDITIEITIFYFDSWDECAFYANKFKGGYQNGILTIVSPSINGMIPSYFLDGVIQHELSHIYQHSKANKNVLLGKNNQLYKVALLMMEQLGGIGEKIGRAIYYSFKTEENAFGNTMYAQMMKYIDEPWKENYKQTEMFQQIQFLKQLCDDLEKPNNAKCVNIVIEKYLKTFGFTTSKLISLTKETYSRYVKRSGRILSLIIDRNKLQEAYAHKGIKPLSKRPR